MKDKSKGNNYWLVSGFLTLLQNFSGVFFGFAGFYILVRNLEKADYGVWVLFMSTITIVEATRVGLIQTALIKFLASEEEDNRASIVSAAMLLSGIVTLVCVVLNLSFSSRLATMWKSPELNTLFLVYNLGFILSGVLNFFNWLEQAALKFNGIFVTGLIRQGLFFLYIGASYIFHYRIHLIELVWVQVGSVLVASCVGYLYARPYLMLTQVKTKYWMGRLFGYGKFSFGTLVGSLLSSTLDQMMLGAMLSPVASGAFNIAVRITNLIDIPTNAMAVIVFPQSAKRMATEGKSAFKHLYEKSVGSILALLVPGVLFLYFFAEWAIGLIAGERYDDSIPLLKITLLYCLLIPYGRQFGTMLDSIGRTKTTFTVVLVTMTINLGLNFVFIKNWGVMGAAYATLTSNIIGFAIGQTILRKQYAVNLLNIFVYMYQFYPELFRKYVQPFVAKKLARNT